MRKTVAFLILAVAMLFAATVRADRPPTDKTLLFPTATAAKNHCPNDTLVWLNPKNRVYYFNGQQKFGKTKGGAFVCKQDADKMGEKANRSGH